MKTFALQGDTLDGWMKSGITGALRAWSRPCSPQIRDWLNWVRCRGTRHRRRIAPTSVTAPVAETVDLWVTMIAEEKSDRRFS